MHADTSEGGAVNLRRGFWSVPYLEVEIRCKNALGPRIVSAVGVGRWSLLRRCQCMGFSIRDQSFVHSRVCVRFSVCPLREVLL